ncbi:hypothetical protein PMAYCL1PPCAC_21009, partial [Pristionchus mayeri]
MRDFVHRDINIGRFAVGIGPYEQQIYMYNLKDMKKFRTARGHIKRSKEEIPFAGSLLFGSRNAMKGGEQSRRDDLESWLYMTFDVFDRQTYSSFFERESSLHNSLTSINCFRPDISKSFFKKIPHKFAKLCKYVNGLNWHGDPDYVLMEDILLNEVLSENNKKEMRRSEFLDWTGKIEMREDLKTIPTQIINSQHKARPEIVSSDDMSSKSDGSSEDE